MYKKTLTVILFLASLSIGSTRAAEHADTLFLSVERLFERGVKYNLQLQADALETAMAHERTKTARTSRLPDLQIGLRGGYVGQPVVFQHGLSDPTHPETPDWSQNYAIDFTQPLYEGGRIRYSIRQADMEKQVAELQQLSDEAEVKLSLLNQYMNLFSLFKQHEVLSRNIEESEIRLHDIRRMKKEGLITNNDVLRSEMQLTNDRLSLQETENSIALVSQQLNILLGQDETLLLKPDTTLLYRYLPVVSLYASNTLARPLSRTMADMYNNTWNVGLSVSYPLSSLFKENHRIKESKLQVSLRKNEESQKQQNIRIEVRTAYLRHKEALLQVEALKLSVRQAEENYRIMQNRYMNQLAILTDLLDANSVRLNVELQLTTARTRVIYTYYQLLKACGRI